MDSHRLPEEGVWPPSGVVTTDIMIKSVLGHAETVPIPARFSYDRRRPFAVLLEMPRSGDRENAQWSFARDLLQAGMHRPSGEGDVRIWPPCLCHDRPDVRIFLRGSTGSHLLDIPSQPLRDWLVHTWEVVPPGEENAWIDGGIVLERLLSGC